jgi:hypothetical protein
MEGGIRVKENDTGVMLNRKRFRNSWPQAMPIIGKISVAAERELPPNQPLLTIVRAK